MFAETDTFVKISALLFADFKFMYNMLTLYQGLYILNINLMLNLRVIKIQYSKTNC